MATCEHIQAAAAQEVFVFTMQRKATRQKESVLRSLQLSSISRRWLGAAMKYQYFWTHPWREDDTPNFYSGDNFGTIPKRTIDSMVRRQLIELNEDGRYARTGWGVAQTGTKSHDQINSSASA